MRLLLSIVLLFTGYIIAVSAQDFTFTCEDTVQSGVFGETNHFYLELTNTSGGENIIQLDLDISGLPGGWYHSLCVGELCLPPFILSYNDTMTAGQLDSITVYITPDSISSQGTVNISAFSLQNPGAVQEFNLTVTMESSVFPEEGNIPPHCYYLFSAYPNPFNQTTVLSCQLPSPDYVELIICDIMGHEVDRLIAGFMNPGRHDVLFNGRELPSGVYFACLRTAQFSQTRKILLLK